MLESMERGDVMAGGDAGGRAVDAGVRRVDVRHTNWVGGEAVASRGGLYEVFARDGSGVRLGEWPRSDARDIGRALDVLGALEKHKGEVEKGGERGRVGAGRTGAGPAAMLRAADAAPLAALLGLPAELAGALDRAARPGPVGELVALARLLALDEGQGLAAGGQGHAAPHDRASRVPEAFQTPLDPALRAALGGPGASASPRVAVLVADRDQLPQDLTEEVERLTAAGVPVLLVAAEEAPLAAALACERLLARAAPVALVHAPTTAAWQRLASDARIGWVFARSGGGLAVRAACQHVPPARRLVRPRVEALTYWGCAEGGPPARASAPAPRVDLPALAARPLPAVRHIAPDPGTLDAQVAAAVAHGAGPLALGGFAHAATALHVVAPACYPDLVERFRAALAAEPALPTWPDADLRRAYAAAWRGAIDAGATLIAGGTERTSPDGPLLAPTLLVNVPHASRWARSQRPLAQLRLVRSDG